MPAAEPLRVRLREPGAPPGAPGREVALPGGPRATVRELAELASSALRSPAAGAPAPAPGDRRSAPGPAAAPEASSSGGGLADAEPSAAPAGPADLQSAAARAPAAADQQPPPVRLLVRGRELRDAGAALGDCGVVDGDAVVVLPRRQGRGGRAGGGAEPHGPRRVLAREQECASAWQIMEVTERLAAEKGAGDEFGAGREDGLRRPGDFSSRIGSRGDLRSMMGAIARAYGIDADGLEGGGLDLAFPLPGAADDDDDDGAEDDDADDAEAEPAEPDEAAVRQLQEMGFAEALCRKALQLRRNHVPAAAEWLLAHADDPAAAAPLTPEELRQLAGPSRRDRRRRLRRQFAYNLRQEADPEALHQLMEMGFEDDQARRALRASANNVELACQMLLSNAALPPLAAAGGPGDAAAAASAPDDRPLADAVAAADQAHWLLAEVRDELEFEGESLIWSDPGGEGAYGPGLRQGTDRPRQTATPTATPPGCPRASCGSWPAWRPGPRAGPAGSTPPPRTRRRTKRRRRRCGSRPSGRWRRCGRCWRTRRRASTARASPPTPPWGPPSPASAASSASTPPTPRRTRRRRRRRTRRRWRRAEGRALLGRRRRLFPLSPGGGPGHGGGGRRGEGRFGFGGLLPSVLA